MSAQQQTRGVKRWRLMFGNRTRGRSVSRDAVGCGREVRILPASPAVDPRSSVWVRVSVLRDPTVGVSVESHGVLFILVTPSQQCLESKLGFFLFFCLALWVVGIEEFQMMVTVQIKLPLCFTQVNGTDLSNYFSNLF